MGHAGFSPSFLDQEAKSNKKSPRRGGGGKIPSVFRSFAWLLFLLGVQPSPEARWKGVCVCGGESLQAKLGRKLEVAFLATTNINNNNKKRSPPSTLRLLRVPSPESGGWERGSTTPPRSFSNGGTWSRPALCTFSSFSFPLSPSTLHLFFLTHFFCFFLSFFFFLTFFSVFFVCFFVFFFPSLLSCLLALLLPGPRSLQ